MLKPSANTFKMPFGEELDPSVVAKFAITAADGKRKEQKPDKKEMPNEEIK